jgi:hypothetical protein
MELGDLRVKYNKLITYVHRIKEAFDHMCWEEMESEMVNWRRGFDPGTAKEHSQVIYRGDELPDQESWYPLNRAPTL